MVESNSRREILEKEREGGVGEHEVTLIEVPFDYLLKVCYASYGDSASSDNVTPLEPVNSVVIHNLSGNIKTITL